jgi:hypothetical protein
MTHPGTDDPRTNEPEAPPTPSVTNWMPSQPSGEPAPSPPSPFSSGTDQPSAGGRPFVAAQTDPTTGQTPPVAPPVAPTPAVATPGAPPAVPVPTPQYPAGPPTGAQPPVGPAYHPVPSPPTYDPAAVAQPYSAQPYSAQPYSAHPYSAQPYSVAPASGAYAYGMPGAMPAPPAPRPRRTGTVVLSILTTLFVLVAGVMTTLFVLTKQDRDRLDNQVQQLGVEATDQRQRIDTLQSDLANTRRDLTDSQAEAKEVADQKAKVSACVKSFLSLLEALNRSNGEPNAEVRRLDRAFTTACNEADDYLD